MAIDANPSSSCEYVRLFQVLGFSHLTRPANLSTIGVVQVSILCLESSRLYCQMPQVRHNSHHKGGFLPPTITKNALNSLQVSNGNSTSNKDIPDHIEKNSVDSRRKIAPLPSFAAKELNSWAMCSGADCLSTTTINIMSYPALIFVKKVYKFCTVFRVCQTHSTYISFHRF